MTSTILVIADDESIRSSMRDACREIRARLVFSTSADPWWDQAPEQPALIICDYPTFDAVRRRWARACVVLYAEKADGEQAIEGIKRGALDYLIKPLQAEAVGLVLESALRISRDIRVPAVYEHRAADERGVERIIGQSPTMKEVYKLIGLIAPRDINVLITGESGSGKELVARAILHHSPRREHPFLAVNCAAIPETLLESELFGHEKGAFTGAELRRIGKFEQCHGGTLFLDEIGDIPLATQAKLLRVLQDGSFQRLGGTEMIRCDVRILAATHQPLEELIEKRAFRQDLYYRLKVASIQVPPLREREVDVVLLAHHFVGRYNREFGTQLQRFSPETLPLLLSYAWPGNVRELENAIKSALVVARGSVLRPEFLPEALRQPAQEAKRANGHAEHTRRSATNGHGNGTSVHDTVARLLQRPAVTGHLHREAMTVMERVVLQAAVEETRGNMARAARLLGISRTTLRAKMTRLGLGATVKVRPRSAINGHL